MTRTFLIAMSYDDQLPPDPIADAQEIEDVLNHAGLPVESVKAWNAPVTSVASQPFNQPIIPQSPIQP